MNGAPGRRDIVLDVHCRDDLEYWTRTHRWLALRAFRLIEATSQDPFDGREIPSALRGELTGCRSRRIDHEHRLVYMVEDGIQYRGSSTRAPVYSGWVSSSSLRVAVASLTPTRSRAFSLSAE